MACVLFTAITLGAAWFIYRYWPEIKARLYPNPVPAF